MTFNNYGDFLRQKTLCNIYCSTNTIIPVRNFANFSIFNRYRNLYSRIPISEITFVTQPEP